MSTPGSRSEPSSSLDELLIELDRRIQELESLPYPAIRDQVFDALQLVDRAHRPGVARLYETLERAGLVEQALEDEAVRVLFMLYDLGPRDPISEAEAALDAVRPYIESHGGELEVVDAEDGVVHVRLAGACGSCSASPATLENGVEVALREGLEGFRRLVVHEPESGLPEAAPGSAPTAPPDLVHLGGASLSFVPVREGPASGAPLEVAKVADREVLVVRLDVSTDEVRAFEPSCPGCGSSLAEGSLSGTVLVCPFRGCAYDVATGRRVDGVEGRGLRGYPVSAGGGRVAVAIDVAPMELLSR